MQDALLGEAFSDPVADAQSVFRLALSAMSEPGTVHEVMVAGSVPEGLAPATYSLCLTLFDNDTSVWLAPDLDTPAIRANLAFHCGCPVVNKRADALFALVTLDGLDELERFNQGTDRDPHQSCTAIVQLDSLRGGQETVWQGPGIRDSRRMQLPLTHAFWDRRRTVTFPRGLDFFFTAGRHLAGLPRSTRVLCNTQEAR